jgi:hypothetical protein
MSTRTHKITLIPGDLGTDAVAGDEGDLVGT